MRQPRGKEQERKNMPDDVSAVIDHSVTLSPQQAGSQLAELTAAFNRVQVPEPRTANEARQRWASLAADSDYQRRFSQGDAQARSEKEKLDNLIASSTAADALTDSPAETPVEVTIGQEARNQDWIGMVADWRRVGVPEAAIEFVTKGGRFPAADAANVRNKFLPNAMAMRDQGHDVEYEIACLSMIAGFGADE
jgi:hypothetical protein